uniref:CCN family member 3 n=1 Tax=Crocodylus porosus TaxID=8502 RepID=A0A7M4FKP3_CROPO
MQSREAVGWRKIHTQSLLLIFPAGWFLKITCTFSDSFAFQVESQVCSYPCQCPSQPLQCPAGTSHVLDACGCCKVCARQLGELCSLQKPCDHHKGLYCDFSKIHSGSGICLGEQFAHIYHNGESFQPTCKLQCICMDGAIGCIPLCSDDLRLPSPDCPNPRRVKLLNKALNPLFTYKPELNNLQENCLVQTTEWSACSRTCGMGISSRVTNDNPQCRLEKESQLCMVRPCNFLLEKSIKVLKGKKCVRTPKHRQAIHLEFSGCTSVRTYRPKFCGSCTDGRCCTPHTTSTAEVDFRCPEGDIFQRKMMFIRTCSCHHDCPRDNDIFLATYHRRMIGDHIRAERQ